MGEVPRSFEEVDETYPQETRRTSRVAWQTSVVPIFHTLTRVSWLFTRTSSVACTSTRRRLCMPSQRTLRWKARQTRILCSYPGIRPLSLLISA